MNRLLFILILITACTGPSSQVENELDIFGDPDNAGIIVPDGFQVLEVASELGPIRHVVVRENGDIYANLRRGTDSGEGLVALRDTTGDGRADIIEHFGAAAGTGIGIRNGYLYYSSRIHPHHV